MPPILFTLLIGAILIGAAVTNFPRKLYSSVVGVRGGAPPKHDCIVNLKMIDGAKQQWAIENEMTGTNTPTKADLYGTNLYLKVEPTCPKGGIYTIGAVNALPTCTMAVQDGHTL